MGQCSLLSLTMVLLVLGLQHLPTGLRGQVDQKPQQIHGVQLLGTVLYLLLSPLAGQAIG